MEEFSKSLTSLLIALAQADKMELSGKSDE